MIGIIPVCALIVTVSPATAELHVGSGIYGRDDPCRVVRTSMQYAKHGLATPHSFPFRVQNLVDNSPTVSVDLRDRSIGSSFGHASPISRGQILAETVPSNPDIIRSSLKFDLVNLKAISSPYVKKSPVHRPLNESQHDLEGLTAMSNNQSVDAGYATEITVSTHDELYKALTNAKGGETILLEAGQYGDLVIAEVYGDFDFPEEVTIRSIDPENPAVFNSIEIHNSENITFDSIKVDFDVPEGQSLTTGVDVKYSSQNITFKNSEFVGDDASGVHESWDGYPIGIGFRATGSSGIVLENNEFTQLSDGIFLHEISDAVISGNDIHGLSNDGVKLAAVQGVTVDNNHIHDFLPSPDSPSHMDFIQVFSSGTKTPTSDIVISNNVLNSGEGAPAQAIFIRNELVDSGLAGDDFIYQNITIENNVIHGGSHYGIGVNGVDNLIIDSNTILDNRHVYGEHKTAKPTVYVDGHVTNAVITNNIMANELESLNPDNVVSGNVVVQRDFPDGENYVGDLFVNGLANKDASVADLTVLPGTVIDGVGSSLTAFNPDGEGIGHASHEIGTGFDSLKVQFTTEAAYGVAGELELAGATAVWDFGDGNSGAGLSPEHTYSTPGFYTAKAVITLADGNTVELARSVEVESPILAKITGDDGIVDVSGRGQAIYMSDEVAIANGDDGSAIDLNNGTLFVARAAEFQIQQSMTVGVDFKPDAGTNGGTLIHQNGGYSLSVVGNKISLRVISDQGTHNLSAVSTSLTDGQSHAIAFTYSGLSGEIKLFLDGDLVDSIEGLQGVDFTGTKDHIYLGDPFKQNPFDGIVDNLVVIADVVPEKDIVNLRDFSLSDVKGIDYDEPDGQVSNEPQEEPQSETLPPEKPAIEDENPLDESMNVIEGDGHDDTIYGQAEDDLVEGNGGNDNLAGGAGNDIIRGGDGKDVIHGGHDDDKLFGGAGNDIIGGQWGDDFIDGGAGRDWIVGDDGDDTIVFDANDFTIRGGDGFDTVEVTSVDGQIARFKFAVYDIEKIEMTNGSRDAVALDHYNLRSASAEDVYVTGDAGDTVIFDVRGSFQSNGVVEIDGQSYFHFTSVRGGEAREFFFEDDLVVGDEQGLIYAGANNIIDDGFVKEWDPLFVNYDLEL